MLCNGMFAIIIPCLLTEIPVATYGDIDRYEMISLLVSISPNPENILEKTEHISCHDSIESICFTIGPT